VSELDGACAGIDVSGLESEVGLHGGSEQLILLNVTLLSGLVVLLMHELTNTVVVGDHPFEAGRGLFLALDQKEIAFLNFDDVLVFFRLQSFSVEVAKLEHLSVLDLRSEAHHGKDVTNVGASLGRDCSGSAVVDLVQLGDHQVDGGLRLHVTVPRHTVQVALEEAVLVGEAPELERIAIFILQADVQQVDEALCLLSQRLISPVFIAAFLAEWCVTLIADLAKVDLKAKVDVSLDVLADSSEESLANQLWNNIVTLETNAIDTALSINEALDKVVDLIRLGLLGHRLETVVIVE
jgi:hypothetical protein